MTEKPLERKFVIYQGSPLVDESVSIPRELELLHYLKDTCGVEKIYYPGSGGDPLPKKVFGENCINGTLSQVDSQMILQNSQNIFADYRKNPFPNNSFDAIYLHGLAGQEDLLEIGALSEITRIIKDNGLIVWVDEAIPSLQSKYLQKIKELRLKDVTPKIFSEIVGKTKPLNSNEESGHTIVIFQKQKILDQK